MQTYTHKHKTHRICTQTHMQAQTHTHVCTLVECRKVFGPFTQVCHFQDTLDNISNQAHIIWPLLPLIKRPDKFIVNQNAWNQWPWYVHQAGKGVDLRVPHQNALHCHGYRVSTHIRASCPPHMVWAKSQFQILPI